MHGPEDTILLNDAFEHHPPVGDQVQKYAAIRARAKYMAGLILDVCPDSRERSLAITKLREAMMWANSSIAIHGSRTAAKG